MAIRSLAVTLAAACFIGTASAIPRTPAAAQPAAVDVSGASDPQLRQLTPFIAVDQTTGARVHLFPTPRTFATMAAQPGNELRYHGGPVQTVSRIYLVLWGANWSSSAGDPAHVQTYLENYYPRIGGTRWLNTVTQYTQTNGLRTANVTGSFRGTWHDVAVPPSAPTVAQVAAEAARSAAHFGDRTTAASYVVALPRGVKPPGFGTQFCAYHSYASLSQTQPIAFTTLPYMADPSVNCGAYILNQTAAGIYDGQAIVAGHEQAETETDPFINAWLDSSGAEIGDKCAWQHLIDNPQAYNYPTQPLWSDRTSGCVQAY